MVDLRILPYIIYKPLALIATILAIPLLVIIAGIKAISNGKKTLHTTNGLWSVVNTLGGWGRLAFSQLFYFIAPYALTIDALWEEVAPGHAVLSMVQRYGLQNPFSSVHAVALINLGEMTVTGAFLTLLHDKKPKGSRAIPVGIRAQYYKKARGKLTARCDISDAQVTNAKDQEFVAAIMDKEGIKVCDVWISFKVDIELAKKNQ